MGKLLAVILILLVTGLSASGFAKTADWQHYELLEGSSNAGKAHLSANQVESDITRTLRAHYPARLVSVKQQILIEREQGTNVLTYIWRAEFKKTTVRNADWHFAREGALYCSISQDQARILEERNLAVSHKKDLLLRKFPHGHLSTWTSAFGSCVDKEFFITARKQLDDP